MEKFWLALVFILAIKSPVLVNAAYEGDAKI